MRSLGYNLKQAFRQVFRNKGMSLPSILSIFAMMLVLGVFFVLTVNLNMVTETVKQDYDEIEVFILEDATQEEVDYMMGALRNRDGVSQVTYRSKGQAMEILRARWGDNAYLLDSLGDNPLPASVLITVNSLDNAGTIAEYAGSFKAADDVQYYRETVDKLVRVMRWLETGAMIIMAFMLVVCIVVVANTVKLTVLARVKEIQVMRYVGATGWFIRGPFLLEGIIIGLISAVMATGVITFLYDRILRSAGTQILAIVQSPLIPADYVGINMLIIFAVVGVSIGAWGSLISMRRFLKA